MVRTILIAVLIAFLLAVGVYWAERPDCRTPEGQAQFIAAFDAVLALWPVPYEAFDVPTRFGSTHVIASGPKDAPPLVLLHEATAGATMWFRNIADLSRRYRTYALDIIGDTGKSVVSQPPQKKSDYADWLTDVFNGLKIERADVVGASYGGWVTMSLALYAPARVKKIVLIAPADAFGPFDTMFMLRMIPSSFLPIRPLLNNSIRPIFAKQPNEKYFEQLVRAATCQRDMVFPTEFADGELQQIKTPTLLLIGDKEVILADPRAQMDRASRLMPHIQTLMIPDAGHMLPMDQPEIVDALILKFLQE